MIEEKIRQWCAAATVEEAGERVVVVPDRDVAEVCRRLHDDAEEPMDFMRFLPAFCFSRSLRLRETSPP